MFEFAENFLASSIAPTLVVVVRVSTDCSLSCQHCGFSRELPVLRRCIDTAGLLRLGASLQLYQQRSNRRVLVSWLGGEPFQWANYQEVSTHFREVFGLSLSVTTNGLALASEPHRSFALRQFHEITISIDGLEPHHDRMRCRPGMFLKLKKTIRQIQLERNPDQTRLRVNTVLTKFNADTFTEFCKEMAEWGFDELTFNPLGGNDRPEFYAEQRLSRLQMESLRRDLESIRTECSKIGMQIRGGEGYLRRIEASVNGDRIPILDCKPGENFLFVNENGLISPCSFTCESLGVPMTEWKPSETTTLAEKTDTSSHFAKIKREQPPKPCSDCLATHVFDKFG